MQKAAPTFKPIHPSAAPRARFWAAALAAGTITLSLSGCGTQAEPETGGSASSTAQEETYESDAAEVAAAAPRLVITYDGGLQVLDALTLELVADLPLDGFNRVNPAGDQRHVMVSVGGGFRLLDSGSYAVAHGDHAHYYAAAPILEDGIAYPAERPGHVVPHDDLTALFDDATGHVVILEADDLDNVVRQYQAPAAHHGVAVALPDGTLLVSQGTEESRNGLVALDADDAVQAESSQCPGIHGEGVASGEAAVFGCQGGALIYSDGTISFSPAPEADGQISTLAATEDSAVALGNYQVAGSDAPATRVSLIDTAAKSVVTVDIGVPYSGRGLARTDDGVALVLGTDGKLHLIDPDSAQETAAYQVIDPFELPQNWQDPVPGLLVLEGMVYVTDPATRSIQIVDPATGSIWRSGKISVVPNEMAGVSGLGAGEHDHSDHEEED
jgi:hypothetical protein